jgi:hypothetical protein
VAGCCEEEVGVAGFEPTTSWSQTRRSTKLSYTPNNRNLSDFCRETKERSAKQYRAIVGRKR